MLDFSDKTVLVTGACGTIGRRLVHFLCEGHQASRVIGLDNNEAELFAMESAYARRDNVCFFLNDIRDRHELVQRMRGVHVVFHTAAFKHVIFGETSPFESVQTNILGVQNVVVAARANRVEKVIFTSSDKAVNPTSVMGTSKLMGERLITAANYGAEPEDTVFTSTRFGNVLGSSGSVMNIFRDQIRAGGPVTVTDPAMTRFVMTVDEAAQLVIESAGMAKGGEVFVSKMPAIRIADLAEVMIAELAPIFGHQPECIRIDHVGAKPGEKLYEELLSDEETRRSRELEKYFVIVPAFRDVYREISYRYPEVVSERVENSYTSRVGPYLSQDRLSVFLRENGLLDRRGFK